MRLTNRVALITGGAQGIGRAIALRFAEEGAHVAIADLQEEKVAAVAREVEAKGRRALALKVDMTKEAEVQHIVSRTVAAFGTLNIVVNNAGIEIVKKLEDMNEAEWDRIYAVNVKGVFLGCKYAIPELRKAGGGSIINLASGAALIGVSHLAAYCGTKGAVKMITAALAQELKPDNIRVNCLCPAVIDTDMGRRAIELWAQSGVPIEGLLARQGGRYGKPEEVAAEALFLASDDASFLTGHALPVDGGAFSE